MNFLEAVGHRVAHTAIVQNWIIPAGTRVGEFGRNVFQGIADAGEQRVTLIRNTFQAMPQRHLDLLIASAVFGILVADGLIVALRKPVVPLAVVIGCLIPIATFSRLTNTPPPPP